MTRQRKVGFLDWLATFGCLLVGGLLLLGWPVAIMVITMGQGAPVKAGNPEETMQGVVRFVGILVGVYPVVYIYCLTYAIKKLTMDRLMTDSDEPFRPSLFTRIPAVIYASFPLFYIGIPAVILYVGFFFLG